MEPCGFQWFTRGYGVPKGIPTIKQKIVTITLFILYAKLDNGLATIDWPDFRSWPLPIIEMGWWYPLHIVRQWFSFDWVRWWFPDTLTLRQVFIRLWLLSPLMDIEDTVSASLHAEER